MIKLIILLCLMSYNNITTALPSRNTMKSCYETYDGISPLKQLKQLCIVVAVL